MTIIADVEWEARVRVNPESDKEWTEFFNKFIRTELPHQGRAKAIKLLDEGGQRFSVRYILLNEPLVGEEHRIHFKTVRLPEGVRFPIHLLDEECRGALA